VMISVPSVVVGAGETKCRTAGIPAPANAMRPTAAAASCQRLRPSGAFRVSASSGSSGDRSSGTAIAAGSLRVNAGVAGSGVKVDVDGAVKSGVDGCAGDGLAAVVVVDSGACAAADAAGVVDTLTGTCGG